jgi:hypothetical protein
MEVRSRAEVLWASVEVRSETEAVLSGMVAEVELGREWP